MKKISLDFDPIRIKEIKKIMKFEKRKYFKEQSEVLLGLGIETWNEKPSTNKNFVDVLTDLKGEKNEK